MKQRLSLSLSTKIFLGFVLLLLIFGGVELWSVYQLRRIGKQLRILRQSDLRILMLASQLEALQLNKKSALSRLFSLPSKDLRDDLKQRLEFPPIILRKIKHRLLRLKKLSTKLGIEQKSSIYKLLSQLKKILHQTQYYQTSLHSLFKAAKQPLNTHTTETLRHQFRETELRLRRSIITLSLQMDTRLTQAVLRVEREERRAVWLLLLLCSIAVTIGLVVSVLSRIPLRRIDHLVEMAQRIGKGDLQLRVEIRSRDEIGTLATAFNQMADSLGERDRHLAQQRKELEEAYRDLQDSTERLRRSERLAAIGQLAAQITHEIRNPLNAIGLNLEVLEEDLEVLPNPNAEENLYILRSTMAVVEHLTQITEEYLRFARLPPPQLEATDPNALLTDLMEFLSGELISNNVRWTLKLEPDLPKINIDQRQLRQALINLIRNAMQAAASKKEDPGKLFLTTKQHNNSIDFLIEDNGAGIPKEEQDKIFDPFFSTKEDGSGLGLPLTQQIIIGHGGQILCQSNEGKGTRFIISLPATNR